METRKKMNKTQKQIVQELKKEARRLKHSPKKREVSNSLWWRCYRYLDSFNNAKKIVGLSTVNIRVTHFPKNAFKLDKDMAHIASYLTFDGHIYKTLKGMAFYSIIFKDLQNVEKIFERKFRVKGKYYMNAAGFSDQTHRLCVFNKKIALELGD